MRIIFSLAFLSLISCHHEAVRDTNLHETYSHNEVSQSATTAQYEAFENMRIDSLFITKTDTITQWKYYGTNNTKTQTIYVHDTTYKEVRDTVVKDSTVYIENKIEPTFFEKLQYIFIGLVAGVMLYGIRKVIKGELKQ